MSRPILLSLIGVAGFSLGGCETIFDQDRGPRLTGQQWELVTIERPSQPEVMLSRDQARRHNLQFESDGRVTMQLDCNRGTASWSSEKMGDGGSLSIGEIAATRALCPSPSYGEEMAASLPLANQYSIDSGGRTLTIRTRVATYRFVSR